MDCLILLILAQNDPNEQKKRLRGLIGSVAPLIAISKLDPSLFAQTKQTYVKI